MKFTLSLIIFLFVANIQAQKIIVAQDGTGDFTNIQSAINSLPDSNIKAPLIFIKPGVYNEKIFITKHNIIIEGASKEKTIITQSIARDEWRCNNQDDWGVATINVKANDITLKKITVINSFGNENLEYDITCTLDSNKNKKITKHSHQMALRTMFCTRLKAIDCHFIAYGGDTVSPWEVTNGLWFFKNCIIEGGVDFYCPRGWAWAENCTFICKSGTAAIWHDGSANESAATVLKNCTFKGFNNFNLGRYHRDAQFYLLNCKFADNMNDNTIYQVSTQNNLQWGRRVFFYNCKRKAGNYNWFKNNIEKTKAKSITINWLFKNKWNP
jgi:pectinesterase